MNLFINCACQLPLNNNNEKSPDSDLEAKIIVHQTQNVYPPTIKENPTQDIPISLIEITQIANEIYLKFISKQ